MTDPLSAVASLRPLEDPELAADLRRDLGVDTLFVICAIEAALGVERHIDDGEEIRQPSALLLEEAA